MDTGTTRAADWRVLHGRRSRSRQTRYQSLPSVALVYGALLAGTAAPLVLWRLGALRDPWLTCWLVAAAALATWATCRLEWGRAGAAAEGAGWWRGRYEALGDLEAEIRRALDGTLADARQIDPWLRARGKGHERSN